jgi:hypothetical protein
MRAALEQPAPRGVSTNAVLTLVVPPSLGFGLCCVLCSAAEQATAALH